jgi:hypothetical protein
MEYIILVNRYGRVLIFAADYADDYGTRGGVRFVNWAPSIEVAINLCSGAPVQIVAQGGAAHG